MLDEKEQRLWDEIERNYHARHHGGGRELPAPIIGGIWAAVFLTMFGAFVVAVTVGAVTLVMWLLWRFLPQIDAPPAGPDPSDPDAARGPVEEQPALLWHQRASAGRR